MIGLGKYLDQARMGHVEIMRGVYFVSMSTTLVPGTNVQCVETALKNI